MSESLSEVLVILVVGMITVFGILGIVVATGKGLIYLTNRFDKKIKQPIPLTSQATLRTKEKKDTIEYEKIAAIVAAVNAVTKGKGKIERIERM